MQLFKVGNFLGGSKHLESCGDTRCLPLFAWRRETGLSVKFSNVSRDIKKRAFTPWRLDRATQIPLSIQRSEPVRSVDA
jgi:hypothetical protein